MRRGEIWLVDLDPVVGSESNKRRPGVLVSNDHANARAELMHRGTLTVVPVTSTLAPLLDFHVLLPAEATGLSRDSKAQAEHVRSVDVRRLVHRAGVLTPQLVGEIDRALRLHLDLARGPVGDR